MTAPTPPDQATNRDLQVLTGTRFVKIAGPCGDWIVIYDPTDSVSLTDTLAVILCDRIAGVGATGVVVVKPARQQSNATAAEYRLVAWQANGQPVPNMTEPARTATCVLAVLKKIASDDTSHCIFDTDLGPITTVYTPSYIGVDIGIWNFPDPDTAGAAGSDALVMAAGLLDPRPGLSVQIQSNYITVAVETLEELGSIDLEHQPSLEPPAPRPTSINFVVPQDPLMASGMGQLRLRTYTERQHAHDLAAAAAASAVALQNWSGLKQLNVWNVVTQYGDIVVQLHEQHRLSTFAKLSTVFFGKL